MDQPGPGLGCHCAIDPSVPLTCWMSEQGPASLHRLYHEVLLPGTTLTLPQAQARCAPHGCLRQTRTQFLGLPRDTQAHICTHTHMQSAHATLTLSSPLWARSTHAFALAHGTHTRSHCCTPTTVGAGGVGSRREKNPRLSPGKGGGECAGEGNDSPRSPRVPVHEY